MRQKVAKEIRRAMRLHGVNPTGPAEMVIAQKVKRMVYVQTPDGPKAKMVTKVTLVNKTKIQYRRVKKALKARLANQ